MKRTALMLVIAFAAGCLLCGSARASEMDVLLAKLVEKGILTPNEAQIVGAEAKQVAAKELAKGEAVTAPSWTQKVKMKGDVRFRTQTDWGKDLGRANQRLRQRVRARIGVEGKVNDQISGGVQIATGSDASPTSTNQTLQDDFSKKAVWFDKIYVDWKPKLTAGMGDVNVTGGKFTNPLTTTELMWDSDINPEGLAISYSSPLFFEDSYPTTFYSNGAYFWLDESAGYEADPMCWVLQGGFKTLINEDWGSTLDGSVAYYDFANMVGKTMDWSQWTNDGRKFNNIDLILKLDNKKFLDHDLPWGLYFDYNVNTAVNYQKAYMLGSYLGKKSPKDTGDWKVFFEWRYLDIDSIFDVLPDSDFSGFDRMGNPKGGGTNTKGINIGLQYALLKDTVLALKYNYTTPLEVTKSGRYEDSARQLFQADVNVKF
ncbi:MAG: putative porin [Candidatus Omnitrophica bacterium]|nr:putative porin [Candidatus Omnitrophota bacterium]MDD4012939.1 putative porin [Candidatus Omnitrophota bacterium]